MPVPFLLLFAALSIVNTEWFASRKGMVYLANTGYDAKLRGGECQILIYGDSTALIGLDPSVVKQRTGLETCNIAEIDIMTTVNGTRVVDDYLRNNPSPRFLVFLYGTDSWDPQARRKYPPTATFEAVTYRLRQPDKLQSLVVLLRHPEDVFTWFEQGMRVAAIGAFSKPLPPETQQIRPATHGQMVEKSHFTSVLTDRKYPTHYDSPDRPWIESLRTRYAHEGTTILVDATPIPACDPTLSYYQGELKGLLDNQLESLPTEDFDIGGKHVNQSGSKLLSEAIGDQIRARMQTASLKGAH